MPADIVTASGSGLEQQATAPLGGLVGTKMVNVLEINLALRRRYGAPAA